MQTSSSFSYLQRGRAKKSFFQTRLSIFSAEKQTILVKKCHLRTGKIPVRTNTAGTRFGLMQFSVSSILFPSKGKAKVCCGHATTVQRCFAGVFHREEVNPLQSKPQPAESNGQHNVRISLRGLLCCVRSALPHRAEDGGGGPEPPEADHTAWGGLALRMGPYGC